MPPTKTQKIAGWILSFLVAAFLLFSSSGKFTEWDGREKMFTELGFTSDLMFKIGILEATLAIVYLVPQTAFIGAILLSGYLGGATLTHLRVGQPFWFPPALGILMWIGIALRMPRIFSLSAGKLS